MVPSSRFAIPPAGARPGRSAPPQMQMTERPARSQIREQFEETASRWRKDLEDRDDDEAEKRDLASRWQQYSEAAEATQEHLSATLTRFDDQKRKYTQGNLWFNKGSPSRISQACLALKRGSTNMNKVFFQHAVASASRWQR